MSFKLENDRVEVGKNNRCLKIFTVTHANLLIEDDALLAEVLMQSLTSQHYVVETATDGQMGEEYVQSAHYDLILLDIELPKIESSGLN